MTTSTCSLTALSRHEGPAAPVGMPWFWTLVFGHHEDRTRQPRLKATREAAMAFAKS
jgi:hypothetical protein